MTRYYCISLIERILWPNSCHFQWPWMTLKVIRMLQDLSNAIRRTFLWHFALFQLTWCIARSLGNSWTSCILCSNSSCSIRKVWHVWFYIHSFPDSVPSVLWRCWLGGRKGIRPVKKWVVGCWRGYLSGARCRLAYGPVDAIATHCLLLQ